MFGRKQGRGFYTPTVQEAPQERMRASFGGRRGDDVISRRLDRQDPVATPEEKSSALEAIVLAVRAAQEIGASPYEVDSAVRGFNVAATRNAQGGNDGLLSEEPNGSYREGDEAGPDQGGNGL